MVSAPSPVMVVSGGAGGIGRATLAAWRARGCTGVGLDSASADSADPGMLRCDVTAEPAVAAAISMVLERYGRVDALVHCAGILGPSGPISQLRREDWQRTLDVHATAGFLLAKHVIGPMARAGGGAIVFAASIVAESGSATNPAYAAAKAALLNLGRSLAGAVARHQIRVNVVSPGSVVGTGLLASSRGWPITATELAVLVDQIPVGRAAVPADVAELMCFLCSPAARHINGAVLTIDGGESLPRQSAVLDLQPAERGNDLGPRRQPR